MLLGLAWRNIWRQPRRTLLNLGSIAFAALVMVFLLAFQLGSYATMKENVLRVFDGFARVQPAGYSDDPVLRRTLDDPAQLMSRLAGISGITAVAPRASTYAILSRNDQSFGAAIVGVDPAREVAVSTLHESVTRGRYLGPGDQDSVVLGVALARNLGVHVGDTVTLLGEARDGTIAADILTVRGIFSTGTDEIDRQFAEMPLSRFQASFTMGQRVNTLVLGGPALDGVTGALGRVREALPSGALEVRSWSQLQPGLAAAISLDLHTSLLWYASLIVVVVFIILNTLLMSVLERTREFGVLLALGMRPGRLGLMIWLELGLLALLGLAVGIALGGAVALVVGHYGIEMPGAEAVFAQWGLPGRLYPRLDWVSATAGPGAMAAAILLAGIFPYRRVRRLEPVSAMRSA
jgi:ABC-type lipoprotein release transport system permease subunit